MPARLASTIGTIGVDIKALDVAQGDMTDEASVTAAIEGMDAVIHCAAVVAALNRADALSTITSNVNGTKNVINAALAAGCDPIIHTSSTAAVYHPSEPIITSELAPAVNADSPYTRSKALCEEFVRDLQTQGKPITIVYPGGVSGPAAGEAYGDLAEGFISMLKSGVVPLSGAAIPFIDVRDLAAVMVAALEPGKGPRRFMTGGTLVDMQELGVLLRTATGRRMPVLPLPGILFRVVGRITDLARKIIPFDTIYTAEAMDLLTLARPSDDSAVHEQLGITYRPVIETVVPMIQGLYDNGLLTAKQVGTIAS
jgi:nucleoside-diphosphate-sugar epimerase